MRLFIADVDKELRLALQLMLHQEPGMHVTGMAVQAPGLLAQIAASEPDVLLLDWHLPGMLITELVADLRGLELPPKIIVISVRPEDKDEAMAAGADGFIGKNAPPDELLEIIRSPKKKVNSAE